MSSRFRLPARWLFVLLPALGCESTQRRLEPPELEDDFGATLETAPITEESVGETQMLHRRVQLEAKGMAVIPTGFFASNGFEVGPGAGVKAGIETGKNFFLGLSFDWAHWDQSEGVSQITSPGALTSVRPDQLYEQLDKLNFLLNGDYDWTLAKSFLAEDKPLKLRFGAGMGLAWVTGDIDPFLKQQAAAVGSDVGIQDYFGFLLRLAASLRWQLTDHVVVFGEAGWDLVSPFSIEVNVDGQRSQVGGDIDFGSIGLGGGIMFEF